ncbi:MAG: exodeoxyribonuclease V subunit alpha [Gammaproteobacteria bacterium]|nr:exodeoxyribonuclease V subunit alpha [Gammaproteobacteria bacterium]
MQAGNEFERVSRLDLAFAGFLSQRTALQAAEKNRFNMLLITLAQRQRQGHTCIEINPQERALLLASGLVCDVIQADIQEYPLIIEDNRLYLQRYWFYENRLAQQITQLDVNDYSINSLEPLLDRHFPKLTDDIDWQRRVAECACRQALTIITGGPGTGKTTTISKILAVLQELAENPLLIALAAPTGKAAMRLQEAIAQNADLLNCPQTVKQSIPQTAVTLHRLLGAKPPSPYFNHHAGNPLIYDVVVVDEASMVDLALMSKLCDALKPGARLILLGDKDQLNSVESGAVLADLIDALPGNTVELTQSHRFNDEIKTLADVINKQDDKTAWSILSVNGATLGVLAPKQVLPFILAQRQRYVQLVSSGAAYSEIYREFSRFQVLCSNRHGANAALMINQLVEQNLFGYVQNSAKNSWYSGCPVMVTQNQLALHLYNGDIGICLPDREQNGQLMVYFQRPDGAVKKILPARMPTCETVFAMTIHKAQGSEFDDVLIVLPPVTNPVLSKELIYTAITRARKTIKIATDQSVFSAAVNNKVGRMTGLKAKLMK